MASWQDYLDGVNPIDTVRGRHEELMKQRKAEDLARMQAANPGYGQGGFGNIQQQQFTQYGPPTLHDNSAEWLQTQRNLYGENIDYNQTGPNAGALSNGQGGQGDQSGRGIGPQSYGGYDPFSADIIGQEDLDALNNMIGTPVDGILGTFLGTNLTALVNQGILSKNEAIAAKKGEINTDQESMFSGSFTGDYVGDFGLDQSMADAVAAEQADAQAAENEAQGYPGVGLPDGFGPAGPIGPSGPTRGPHAGENDNSSNNSGGGTGTGRSGGDAGEGGGTGQGGTGNAGGPSGQY